MAATSPKATQHGDTAKGCGCLLLMLLLVIGMLSSCLGDDDSETSSTFVGGVSGSPSAMRSPSSDPTPTSALAPATTTSASPDPDPEPDPDRRFVPDPEPSRKPVTAPQTEPAESGGSVYYENCDAVRAAGAAPIRRGDPGYASHLDRDGDGEGCGGD